MGHIHGFSQQPVPALHHSLSKEFPANIYPRSPPCSITIRLAALPSIVSTVFVSLCLVSSANLRRVHLIPSFMSPIKPRSLQGMGWMSQLPAGGAGRAVVSPAPAKGSNPDGLCSRPLMKGPNSASIAGWTYTWV